MTDAMIVSYIPCWSLPSDKQRDDGFGFGASEQKINLCHDSNTSVAPTYLRSNYAQHFRLSRDTFFPGVSVNNDHHYHGK